MPIDPTVDTPELRAHLRKLADDARAVKDTFLETQAEQYELWDKIQAAGVMSYAKIAEVTGWSRMWIIISLRKLRESREVVE